MKRGDRVKILREDIFLLRNREKPWRGVITSIDGGYIYVRPMWCKWVTELYENEVSIEKG